MQIAGKFVSKEKNILVVRRNILLPVARVYTIELMGDVANFSELSFLYNRWEQRDSFALMLTWFINIVSSVRQLEA